MRPDAGDSSLAPRRTIEQITLEIDGVIQWLKRGGAPEQTAQHVRTVIRCISQAMLHPKPAGDHAVGNLEAALRILMSREVDRWPEAAQYLRTAQSDLQKDRRKSRSLSDKQRISEEQREREEKLEELRKINTSGGSQ
jgi:hypothetical protein